MNEVRRIEESPQRLRFTVDDYRILHEAGAFEDRPRVELIEGAILTVSPQQNVHAIVKSELAFRLAAKLKELDLPYRAIVEGTLELSASSAVDPDIAISSDGPTHSYMRKEAVRLVVEVANTTEAFDLGEKAVLYARGIILEYWVLVLAKRHLIRHSQPSQSGYTRRDTIKLGDAFASVTIPGFSVSSEGLI